MAPKETEACGRCSVTSVSAATDGNGDAGDNRQPFSGARIDVTEAETRTAAAPRLLRGRAKRRLDEVATQPAYAR